MNYDSGQPWGETAWASAPRTEPPTETLTFRVRHGAVFVQRPGDVRRLLGPAPKGAPDGEKVVTMRVGASLSLSALLVPRASARDVLAEALREWVFQEPPEDPA